MYPSAPETLPPKISLPTHLDASAYTLLHIDKALITSKRSMLVTDNHMYSNIMYTMICPNKNH